MKKLVHHWMGLSKRILDIRDTPHAIAGGVAVGIFMGFTPLFGLKTLLCLGIAWVLRFNVLAAVIAVCLHDIVTPFWPLLLRWQYQIGFWILSHPHRLPPTLSFHHLHPSQWMQWTTFLSVGLPLLLGSVVLALPSGLVAYALTRWIVARRLISRSRRELPEPPEGSP